MPLVAHNQLPSFDRLQQEGIRVLTPDTANSQDIRELHIGLLNMMPDAALAATERQFFRLIGESNPIAQFYVHPFTLDSLPRGDKAKAHIDEHYETFEEIKQQGLDALIITGANVVGAELSNQPFWRPLMEVVDWANDNVTSTLCSCLATHAVIEFRHHQKRQPQPLKKWGVFPHTVVDRSHPLVVDINTRFHVPHSRWNEVTADQFKQAGLKVLVSGDGGCVHLATSEDGFKTLFFQGHPEYDTISLLKEYKREVKLYEAGELEHYPPFPENYFGEYEQALFNEYRYRVETLNQTIDFPDALIESHLDNTWRDSAVEVIGSWIGLVYQVTNKDRKIQFMDSIDENNPLDL